ncbi:helix-turn-helix domain-containing protein [Streptomyces rimosus]|uniref:helix-turn-helix domain-containing protein n=1 Tax=Streptomyces rimosus TaxID=1927 RepID=UPI0031D62DC9
MLDNVPQGPRRLLVARLRTLRKASDLTLAQLSEQLTKQGVVLSVSRLSKFLNGHELPSRAQVAAFHQVCEAASGTACAPQDVRATQQMLYAVLDAERDKKPLRAREFDLEEAREQLARQRAQTADELDALRETLEHERALRCAAEEALQRLAEQAGDHTREIDELTRERDTARRRVAELEDQVRQGEAVVRLRQSEARHLDTMAAETAQEIARHIGEDLPAAQRPITYLSTGELLALVEGCRDEDRDAMADQILARLCAEAPETVPALWEEFRGNDRKLDAGRLLAAAVQNCSGVQLYRLWRTGTFHRCLPFIGDSTYVSGDDLIDVIGGKAPVEELKRFVKACRERDDKRALGFVASACQPRPEYAVQELRRGIFLDSAQPRPEFTQAAPRRWWEFWR